MNKTIKGAMLFLTALIFGVVFFAPVVSLNDDIPPVVELEGRKVWDDADDLAHIRPVSVLIMLYANGELVKSVEATASESDKDDNVWTYYFGEFPNVDENGEAIDYSILEEPVAGYDSHYRGISVINSHATSTPAPE